MGSDSVDRGHGDSDQFTSPVTDQVLDELELLTMGYDDLSEDQLATQLFRDMTQRQRDAIHHFGVFGPALTLQHLKVVADLVDGYHTRDPERKAAIAKEEVLRQIDRTRAYFEVIDTNEVIPILLHIR